MNILNIVKGGTELIVTIGVGAVVGNAIKATTPEEMKLVKKLSVGVGSVVLTSVAGDVASRYVNKQIDNAVLSFKEAKRKIELDKLETQLSTDE